MYNCRSKNLAPGNKENGVANTKANVLQSIPKDWHVSAVVSSYVHLAFIIDASTTTAIDKKLCFALLDQKQATDVKYFKIITDLTNILDEDNQEQHINIKQKINEGGTMQDNHQHKQSCTKTAAPCSAKPTTTKEVSKNVASVIADEAKACVGEELSCSENDGAHLCSFGSVDVYSDLSFDFAEMQQD
ncbi:hypothetical protein ACA910_003048 [Epithemia clementina (nom. ined.)]